MTLPRYLEYVQFQGISLTSRVIQALTGPDSHSAVLDRESPEQKKQLIEQWPHKGGVRAWMDWNDWSGHTKGTPYEIWSLEVTADDYYAIMGKYREAALRKEPYDWSGILSFVHLAKQNPNKTFCSEIMYKYYAERMGLKRVDPSEVHPTMWGNFLEIAGAKLTYKGFV